MMLITRCHNCGQVEGISRTVGPNQEAEEGHLWSSKDGLFGWERRGEGGEVLDRYQVVYYPL